MAYPTVADMRLEGVPELKYNDARLQLILDAIIERVETFTENTFVETSVQSIEVEGTDCDTLWLPLPIVTFTSLKINDSDDIVDPSYYRVIAGQEYYHYNRNNPSIKFKKSTYSIFSGGGSGGVFERDRAQIVTATFGTLEKGDTPKQINWAIRRLVVRFLDPTYGADISAHLPVLDEKVDRHSYRRADYTKSLDGSYWFGDPDIDAIMYKFQAPKHVLFAG